MKFLKYHGAGNDFFIADNRRGGPDPDERMIRRICDRHIGFGSDGLMLLESSATADFRMKFFNPDGSGGMMCGNGGRCIAAFASSLGLGHDGRLEFDAPDGHHSAEILDREGDWFWVRLKMKDVSEIERHEDGIFLDTGTRHFVKFIPDFAGLDIRRDGPALRYDPRFAPKGTNVNFADYDFDGAVIVRTYEKGVENETLACGTGIVATALADHIVRGQADGCRHETMVKARIADLKVEFTANPDGTFTDVWLTGPAEYVGVVEPAGGLFD